MYFSSIPSNFLNYILNYRFNGYIHRLGHYKYTEQIKSMRKPLLKSSFDPKTNQINKNPTPHRFLFGYFFWWMSILGRFDRPSHLPAHRTDCCTLVAIDGIRRCCLTDECGEMPSVCYSFLADGARWTGPAPYNIVARRMRIASFGRNVRGHHDAVALVPLHGNNCRIITYTVCPRRNFSTQQQAIQILQYTFHKRKNLHLTRSCVFSTIATKQICAEKCPKSNVSRVNSS